MSRLPEAYPDGPGFKSAGPSQEAAERVASKAKVLRDQVLQTYRDRAPAGFTADEIARDLNVSILSVRPRVSELHRNGYLKGTGQRRRNESGMSATVWALWPNGPPAARPGEGP